MKITAEFNSNEELISFINTFGIFKATEEPKKATEVKKAEEPKKVEVKKEEPKKEEEITKETIRAAFAKLLKAGKAQEAKDLTAKYGAKKVPDIKEEDYAAVLKDLEELL